MGAAVVERELVQQLAERNAEPPKIYLQKEEIAPDQTLRTIDLPQVDITLLNSPDRSTAMAEVQKLYDGFSTSGYFLAVNHGMSSEFLERIRGAMKEFFLLPVEEKHKLKSNCVGPLDENNNFDGYGFDDIPEVAGSQEWCDKLVITTSPPSDKKLQYWPDKPADFREIMEECNTKVEKLLNDVLKGMARSLNLEENSMVDEMGEPRIAFRFNFFPKCPNPEKILGVNNHTDGSILTFLLRDKDVEGLQLLMDDGEWVRVPVTPVDAIIVDVGDQGEVISNGKFKARLHRAAVNVESARSSLGIFCNPALDKTVSPAKGLVTETTPAKYKSVTNYEKEFLTQAYNRQFIDSLMI